jgi:AGZA family xanthine/uracil permease-like MFS transporter
MFLKSIIKNFKLLKVEILSGLTTFSTMAYVIFINPMILSEAHMDFGAVMVATILITFFASCFMGIIANYPIAVAPGMGVSAYFTYFIVLRQNKTWEEALGIVFLVACGVFLMSVFTLRRKLIASFPVTITKSAIAGIGLFLCAVGLKAINVIVVKKEYIALGNVFSIEALLTLLGLLLIIFFTKKKIKGSFLFVILFIWIVSLLFGLTEWKGFIGKPPGISSTFFKFKMPSYFSIDILNICFSVFLISLFDSSTSLLALAKQLKYIDKNKEIFRAHRAVLADSFGSILAAILGTGSLSYHLESASGIKEGGRTGIVAIVVGFCFLACLVFYPLVSSIPHFATAPVLISVGFLMMHEIKDIKWKDISESLPSLIIMIMMPLTFSIYKGFAYGFISYVLVKVFFKRWKDISIVCWILSIIFLLKLFFEFKKG